MAVGESPAPKVGLTGASHRATTSTVERPRQASGASSRGLSNHDTDATHTSPRPRSGMEGRPFLGGARRSKLRDSPHGGVLVRKGPPESEGQTPRSKPSSGPSRGPTDGVLSELLKRVIEAGAKNLSAEPMRQLLAEMKLPKDALLHLLSQHLLIQLEETKQNVYRLVSRELKDLLERTNVAEEVATALTRLSLDVTMQVRFSPTEGEAPAMRVKVVSRDDAADRSTGDDRSDSDEHRADAREK
jgi:hypothetical protein